MRPLDKPYAFETVPSAHLAIGGGHVDGFSRRMALS